MRPLALAAKVCLACGYNRITGRNIAVQTGEGEAPARKKQKRRPAYPPEKFVCKNCQYDLAGLKSTTCPECGTVNRMLARRPRDSEYSRRVVRKAWVNPIIMILVGLAISCSIAAAVGGAPAVIGHLLRA